MPRAFLPVATALVALLVCAWLSPAAASAQGGATIATAPTFPYGTPVAGGGQPWIQYYRLPMFAGDRLTLDLTRPDGGDCDQPLVLNLFQPEVTDYTVAQADPIDSTGNTGDDAGMQQYVWTAPFKGAGILQATGCSDGIAAFTLDVTAVHATALAVSAPTLAKRHALVTVSATVTSDAGIPAGSCLINGLPVPVSATGTCARQVRVGKSARQSVTVEYVPNDGWAAATAKRTIRIFR